MYQLVVSAVSLATKLLLVVCLAGMASHSTPSTDVNV